MVIFIPMLIGFENSRSPTTSALLAIFFWRFIMDSFFLIQLVFVLFPCIFSFSHFDVNSGMLYGTVHLEQGMVALVRPLDSEVNKNADRVGWEVSF